jgi:putative alpha-1,2-mannosidase
MQKFLLILLFALCLLPSVFGQARDYTRWVNPFIGTGGHGHTFPGATLPFGMVQLSPDTRIDNWDGSSGYHYSDDVIYGFSHTHLSGTGIPDGCDISFMPMLGDPPTDNGPGKVYGYASKFSHANEESQPGHYSVKLDDGILAEMTATNRVGFHRYTFPKTGKANILFRLGWRDRPLEYAATFADKRRIEGYRISSSWAKRQRIFFVAEFSKPFEKAADDARPQGPNIASVFGNGFSAGTLFSFDTSDGNPITLKVAISYVSIEGARKNLEAELPGWDFDKVRADAKASWNKELSKIEVSGGTDDQTTTFYTALYHTMIHPNVFNDVDGSYRGHDAKIHSLPGYGLRRGEWEKGRGGDSTNPKSKIQNPKSEQYTVFSLWDTFRAAHPLYTIIDQKRTVDFINTFIRIYEQGGRLPVWELWGEETDTMIGYHAVSVIADAMAKGIKGFDYEKAYEAAKHSAELDHYGLAAYKRRGYISGEDENESVSKTLEYAYNDWCLMSMGAMLFNQRSLGTNRNPRNDPYLKKLSEEIDHYRERAGYFENLFDTETHFFRPRRNGGFIKPFEPQEVTFHFTEGNSWQYSFFAPHNVTALIELMGGDAKFVNKLDELFTTETKLSGREQPDITGLMGQYAHGNEPSHHIAYLYDYAGQPSKTQFRVRRILDNFYKNAPDGLIGNEDCGQMSAWYVLSASGFYPVLPGQTRYDLGTPLFKRVVYHLENGKSFVISAPKVSASNFYIKAAKRNGVTHPLSYVVHEQIMRGGVLELEMSDKPNDKAFEHRSISSVYSDWLAVPVIESDARVFTGSAIISIRANARRATIHYTLDSGEPTPASPVYSGPFKIDKPTIVKAAVFGIGNLRSKVVEASFDKRANDWTVKLLSSYGSQYTGGGDNAIIDGLRGTPNFASGEWQGYQGKTFEAVIDLQKETEIRSVGGSFLQVVRSWIWMPDRIEFETSADGVNFTRVAEIKPAFPQQEMNPVAKEFRQAIPWTRARYVRVRAFNFGKIPAWHPGAGGDPWIFVDEILID